MALRTDTPAGPRIDEPSRSDGFVRGLAEAIGGPLGDHAVRRVGSDRFWTAARVVLAMVCVTLSLHWVQKWSCSDGDWQELEQFKHFCYTDVVALYHHQGFGEGKVPYIQQPLEYPVVTGAFMAMIGLPVHALKGAAAGLNEQELFYHLNALALGALAVATVGMLLAIRRRRPWDVAMFALSPALLLTATINWDLLAVAFAVAAIYFWSRERLVLAGLMIGLGAGAKLWPAFLLVALLPLCARAGRMNAFWTAGGTALGTWLAVNVPVAIFWRDNWLEFFRYNQQRAIDWGSTWYIGSHFPRGEGQYGFAWFQSLDNAVPQLNFISYALIVSAWVAIALMVLQSQRRPRLAQVAFLVVVAFLIFGKVWSQQFVLWLLPLALLARPRWGAIVAWQAAEVCYFFAFYGEMMGAAGRPVFTEAVFVIAAIARLVAVVVLAGLVIRDMLHPEEDVVRRTYRDDPEGGVLDTAPDSAWVLTRP